MRSRALAVGAVAATLCGALLPAVATPYAGQFRYLNTYTVGIQGADGARWQLVIEATQSGAVESRSQQMLYLNLDRCTGSGCVPKGRWAKPLSEGEIRITGQYTYTPSPSLKEPSAATVRTTVAGRSFALSLSGTTPGGGGGGVEPSTEPPGLGAENNAYDNAAGSLRLGGLGCTIHITDAGLGEVTTADSVGRDGRETRGLPPAQFPAGFLTGPKPPRC